MQQTGCDAIELKTEGTAPVSTVPDAPEPFVPTRPPVLRIGTHPLEDETLTAVEWWSEEATINRAPIVYGWQGAFMIIIGLQCEGWRDDHGRLEILIRDGDWVVASYIDADVALLPLPGGQAASNLFVVTHEWEEYLESPLYLEVVLSNEVSWAQWEGSIVFEEPAESIFD